MRQTIGVAAALTMIGALVGAPVSEAAFFSFPMALKHQVDRIAFSTPTLPPMAHTLFCARYRADCENQGGDFRRRNIALTLDRWNELNVINREVNRDIVPQPNMGGVATEQWIIAPTAGDCNDYAVTKRHALLARGWPSRALLLSEVIVPSGEHHLVLLVRTKDVDLVLDNLTQSIRPLTLAAHLYRWVRVQSPHNPKYWTSVTVPGAVRMVSLSN